MAQRQKKLTQQQKKFNRELKQDMIAKGIIPPDKPKLNRKKYCDEAVTEWEENATYLTNAYLSQAVAAMSVHRDKKRSCKQ